jgi:hypothetical protein
MSRYPLGQTVTLSTSVKDGSGALTAATAISLILRNPDGTTQNYPAIVNDDLGLYHLDLTVTDLPDAGHYTYEWNVSVAGAGDGIDYGELDVFDPFADGETVVLTLQDAKLALNATESDHDAEIRSYIDSAEGIIAARCGPLVPTTLTKRVYGGKVLLLPTTPVVELVSVTPVLGTELTVTDLWLTDAGTVERIDGYPFTYRLYDVEYVAGRAVIPVDLYDAVRELLIHLWGPQRGRMPSPNRPAPPAPSAAYLLPYRVQALIEPHRQSGP